MVYSFYDYNDFRPLHISLVNSSRNCLKFLCLILIFNPSRCREGFVNLFSVEYFLREQIIEKSFWMKPTSTFGLLSSQSEKGPKNFQNSFLENILKSRFEALIVFIFTYSSISFQNQIFFVSKFLSRILMKKKQKL